MNQNNSELISFFDCPETVGKIKSIWIPFDDQIYQYDDIVYSNQVQKICRRSQKVKKINIEVGHEHIYLFKTQSKRMLQLHVARMELIRRDFGTAIRITRNQQYIDLLCDDLYKLKNILSLKVLQMTFHDEFAVTKMIGKGSFAKVYLAAKKSTTDQYAIKAFNKEFMAEQFKGRESLENEIKVMRRLKQENLVCLHETYETQNSIYFVLDILRGGELLSRARTKILTANSLQTLLYNLLKALVHLHQRKCIHRDLKPENLLLKSKESDTDLVIADFGLATFLNEEILFKRCGTPGFVAPEILSYKEGDPFYDEKCDVFSAGVILYLLLTGKQPFQGPDYKAILKANKNCEVNFNDKKILEQSKQLQTLLKKMMAGDPTQRFSSEECLKHPYFAEIFKETDLLTQQENLNNYDVDYVSGLQKKPSQQSQVGSMELQSRQPALNGNIDTIGSISQYGNSFTKITEHKQQQLQQSKFSQFCQQMKTGNNQDGGSPMMRVKNQQSDLQKIALKNSMQQSIMQSSSKDDDYINEESAKLEDAIQKLNAQTPKMGMLKKASSYKIPKTQQPNS